jgi:exopolysaccharide biosynthesis polyprenyl glycosylphosphotransferase
MNWVSLGFSLFLVGIWGVSLPKDFGVVPWILLIASAGVLARAALDRHHRSVTDRVLILGGGPLGAKLMEELDGSCNCIAGVVDNERPEAGAWGNTPWLGRVDRLTEIAQQVHADRIVVALSDRRGQLPLTQLLQSRVRGIVVEDALEFYERRTGKMAIEALTPGALIHSNGFRNHGTPEAVARVVSVVAAVVGLVILAPLLALIAVAIRLDSRGPVLFMQDRAGMESQPFKLIKFRTMRPCDEHPSEWVRDNDARITRLGRWLRRFRLDELPQLINILRGEMNLVGPRPHPTCNQQIFMERIAYYGLRSTVRPGVTGWAQVRYGYANNIDEETEKMRYDLYYIKNRSLALDARILFETIVTMLRGSGATEVRHRTPARATLPESRSSRLPARGFGGEAKPERGARESWQPVVVDVHLTTDAPAAMKPALARRQ